MKPRARCYEDHGEGRQRRKILTKAQVVHVFKTRWEAEAKKAVLNALLEESE